MAKKRSKKKPTKQHHAVNAQSKPDIKRGTTTAAHRATFKHPDFLYK